MASIFGIPWYSSNTERRYPLDDAASGIDDTGASLPHDIFADLHIRFPQTYGVAAFIGAVQWSSGVRTAVIVASHDLAADGSDDAVPSGLPVAAIAAVTVTAADFSPYRQYVLQPLVPGVAGWVVFGDYAGQVPFRATFSTVQQAMLAMRTARPYQLPPVTGIGLRYNDAHVLAGTVTLRGGTNIKVQPAVRSVDGQDCNVISIALDDELNPDIHAEMSGPVGHRAESGTCNYTPIEQINQVTPDCDGNIDLVFVSNCALVGLPASSSAGLAIDFCLGLDGACNRNLWLPQDGVLANEYPDRCFVPVPSSSPQPPVDPELPGPSSSSVCGELPLMTVFDAWPANFEVLAGSFIIDETGLAIGNTGTRCLAVWNDCAYDSAIGHECEAELSLLPGGLENIGVVIDWQESGPPAYQAYFLVELSKPASMFRLRYFTGTGYTTVADVAPVAIVYGERYTIRVTAQGSEPTTLTCLLYRNTTLLATISYQTNLISANYGLFGIHANQSRGYFYSFVVGAI